MKIKTSDQLSADNLIVKHYAGSISYGTNLPTSDVDYRGIFCGDPVNVRTPFYKIGESTDKSEEDTKFYELSKFMSLVLDCNPNVVETLWVDDRHIVYQHPAYQILRNHRHSFLSKRIAFTTSGYALSQLKRIKGHNKWITVYDNAVEFLCSLYDKGKISKQWVADNFERQVVDKVVRGDTTCIKTSNRLLGDPLVMSIATSKPRQIDFVSMVVNYTERKVLPREFHLSDYRDGYRLVPYGHDIYGVYRDNHYQSYSDTFSLNTTFDGDIQVLGTPLFIVKFNKHEYKQVLDKHNQYWTWRRNRNVDRSQLEELHGYDTKHAMHLIRLLRIGEEVLTTGSYNVLRPDADELLEIRNGKWSYDEVVKYAEGKDEYIRKHLYDISDLPKKPNIHIAAKVLMEIQDLVWSA